MFCEECGCRLPGGALICPECGAKVKLTGDVKNAQRKPQNPSRASAVNTVNMNEAIRNLGGIVLSDGEIIVKQYMCAATRFAVGYLTVTNKRVIYNANGGNSRVSEEITLSSVTGISSYYGKNIDSRQIFTGVMLVIASILCWIGLSSILYIFSLFFFIGICIGAYMIYRAIRSAYQLVIYAKDVNVSPVVIGEGPRSVAGNNAVFAVYSDRTKDTDKMLDEIGALVHDLQTMGDLAIDKWQKRINISNLPAL